MNKREALLQQLRELEQDEPTGELGEQAPGKSDKKPSPFDELPEGWKPEPRYLKPEDCEDRSKGFRIGQFWIDPQTGKKEHRQAYPRPSYATAGGKPGDLITNELSREYAHLDVQWYQAGTDLEICIQYTRQKLMAQGHLDGCAWLNGSVTDWEESDEKRRLAEKWNFLLGLWTGKGMSPPSEKQLEAWARGQE